MNFEVTAYTPAAASLAERYLTPDSLKLEQIWVEALQHYTVNAEQGREIFTAILEAHSAPDRFYHNLQHLREMSDYLSLCREQLARPHELSFAILFHDFVYDPALKNNEEQSAIVAVQFLKQLNLPHDSIARVEALILSTKSHTPVSGNSDSTYFLDADLAILGSDRSRYAQYAADIRREYGAAPHQSYCLRRADVMSHFLERAPFYYHPIPPERGDQARSNINREVQLLRSSATADSICWDGFVSGA